MGAILRMRYYWWTLSRFVVVIAIGGAHSNSDSGIRQWPPFVFTPCNCPVRSQRLTVSAHTPNRFAATLALKGCIPVSSISQQRMVIDMAQGAEP